LLPSADVGHNPARRLRTAACLLLLTLLPRVAVATTDSVNGRVVDPAGLPVASEASAAASADQTLLLEVHVNGHSTGKIGEFTLRHGKLMARPQELSDLGFRVPNSLATGDLIALSELPWLNWSFDEKNQALFVTISDARLLPTVLQANATPDGHRVIESGTGVTLNYDIVNTLAGGQIGTTGSLDLRAFSPWGVASSGWLAYAGAATNASASNSPVRLDSSYTLSQVNTLRRYVLGDFVTGGLAWTRPVHLEGVQIRSDFSMRPDLVTFPLPSVTGSAAVPSTVNVLTDGNLMVSSQVAPGPFEVPQLPVMSGAGTISMTVTNALGQQVTLNQPFYASSSLLAPGLQTYAGQAGLVRRNWGAVSNDYGKMAGTAVYRRGLTRKLTVEGSVESTPGTTMAGAGGVAQIGNLGILNLAAAASTGSGQTGGQFSLGAQRIGRRFSVGASAVFTEGNYRDVASINGDGAPKKQISAFTSLSSRRFGSVGLAYGESDQSVTASAFQSDLTPVHDSQVVSVNYSLQFRKISIYASEFKNLSGTSGSSGMQIGLTIPFGRRSSTSISATSEGTAQFQVQKSASSIGDWGYNAYASAGDSDHEFGQVQYKSPVGMVTAGVDRSAGETTLRIENQGALSVVDRGLFPSNAINDSFAIVDTGSMPNVRVFQENRDVGSTGTSGRLLVPDMRSFDLNHITIEPTDIPPDATIINASREIRPQDRSGVIVRFPIKISHGALLELVDEGGAPVPIGSTATLRSSGATVPIGYDGEAYVQDLSSRNELTVERADGRRCVVAFDYHVVPGDIPTIGPLRCKEQKP
jgi:outer membrane usher protein